MSIKLIPDKPFIFCHVCRQRRLPGEPERNCGKPGWSLWQPSCRHHDVYVCTDCYGNPDAEIKCLDCGCQEFYT